MVAYSGNTDVSISSETGKELRTVNVDVIYFQGPSIKGLSGSPVISRDTGHVVAILTSKLTGISIALAATRRNIPGGGEMIFGGVPIMKTTAELIDTLDVQLANGLGAGTGIEEPKYALRHILRQHRTHK
jgi:hypothetical protein